jgi:hypothetical protein
MPDLDARLATQTTKDVSTRLRLTAVLRGQTIGEVLTEALDGALPSAAALADQMKGAGTYAH